MDNNTLPHVLSELFRDIDNEDDIHAIIAEYQKAMDIAAQYKMNSNRIKNLCALFDDTNLNGIAISCKIDSNTPLIGDSYISLINAHTGYINPILYT